MGKVEESKQQLESNLDVDLECQLDCGSMITASIAIRQLKHSVDVITAETAIIQQIIDEYTVVVESAEEAIEHLEEAITCLESLEGV